MSGQAATIVREKFSLEFVTADAEVVALKKLLKVASNLPELFLFDSEAAETSSVTAVAPAEESYSNNADPVEELRMLFAAAA